MNETEIDYDVLNETGLVEDIQPEDTIDDVLNETGLVEDIQPEDTIDAIPEYTVEEQPTEYPVTFDFDPESLGMVSFAGKVRKSRCWKDIVRDNAVLIKEFIAGIKDEFPATTKITFSKNIFEYLQDKVLRGEIQNGIFDMDVSLPDNTIVLED